jgi:hypothetical protein
MLHARGRASIRETEKGKRGARVRMPWWVGRMPRVRQELGRCGLLRLQQVWASVARKGYCTMNPTLGRWLLE